MLYGLFAIVAISHRLMPYPCVVLFIMFNQSILENFFREMLAWISYWNA
jgi:hypothetical protein